MDVHEARHQNSVFEGTDPVTPVLSEDLFRRTGIDDAVVQDHDGAIRYRRSAAAHGEQYRCSENHFECRGMLSSGGAEVKQLQGL